jgi:hypothetical protein
MSMAVAVVLALGIVGIGALVAGRLVGPALTAVLARGVATRVRRSGPTPAETLSVAVTSKGVTVSRPGTPPGHVGWDQLVEVVVVTTSAGPREDDVFLVLRGADGGSCLVPNPVAKELVPWLLRLPGFDHEKFIAAMGSTSEAAFVCWTGRPGDARVAAEEVPAPGAGTDEGP